VSHETQRYYPFINLANYVLSQLRALGLAPNNGARKTNDAGGGQWRSHLIT
jgi:hypothetical protein